MVRCLACLPSSLTGVYVRHTSVGGAAADPEMVLIWRLQILWNFVCSVRFLSLFVWLLQDR